RAPPAGPRGPCATPTSCPRRRRPPPPRPAPTPCCAPHPRRTARAGTRGTRPLRAAGRATRGRATPVAGPLIARTPAARSLPRGTRAPRARGAWSALLPPLHPAPPASSFTTQSERLVKTLERGRLVRRVNQQRDRDRGSRQPVHLDPL